MKDEKMPCDLGLTELERTDSVSVFQRVFAFAWVYIQSLGQTAIFSDIDLCPLHYLSFLLESFSHIEMHNMHLCLLTKCFHQVLIRHA